MVYVRGFDLHKKVKQDTQFSAQLLRKYAIFRNMCAMNFILPGAVEIEKWINYCTGCWIDHLLAYLCSVSLVHHVQKCKQEQRWQCQEAFLRGTHVAQSSVIRPASRTGAKGGRTWTPWVQEVLGIFVERHFTLCRLSNWGKSFVLQYGFLILTNSIRDRGDQVSVACK